MNAFHFPRLDKKTAELAEAGIRLYAERGAANAWILMAVGGVPVEVIKRVLAFPAQRRASGLGAAAAA
jgi:hypothetical protein